MVRRKHFFITCATVIPLKVDVCKKTQQQMWGFQFPTRTVMVSCLIVLFAMSRPRISSSSSQLTSQSARQCKRVTRRFKRLYTTDQGFRISVILDPIRAGFSITIRLPRDIYLAIAKDEIRPTPRIDQEPICVVADAGPRPIGTLLLDSSKCLLLAKIVAGIGALEGDIHDGSDLIRGGRLVDDFAKRGTDGCVVDYDARDEGECFAAIVGG